MAKNPRMLRRKKFSKPAINEPANFGHLIPIADKAQRILKVIHPKLRVGKVVERRERFVVPVLFGDEDSHKGSQLLTSITLNKPDLKVRMPSRRVFAELICACIVASPSAWQST